MLEMNDKKFVKIKETDLKEQNMLERSDLQEAIVRSWDIFTTELGMSGIELIGTEIIPHESVQDRIDILAFDDSDPENDPNIVIFELKRDKNKNQLIQSISYAGMIHTWTSDDIANKIKGNDELRDFFQNNSELDFGIKIVLIAESYDPEVIMAAEWLREVHGVNICAYSIKLHDYNGKILFNIEQKYPLPELSDVYESRRRNIENKNQERSWEDVKAGLQYEFGKKAIDDLISKHISGNPRFARFSLGKLVEDINYTIWIMFHVRNIYIYICDARGRGKETVKEILESEFGSSIDIKIVEKGLRFYIYEEKIYNKFIKWLGL